MIGVDPILESVRERCFALTAIIDFLQQARPDEIDLLGEICYQWENTCGDTREGNHLAVVVQKVLDSTREQHQPRRQSAGTIAGELKLTADQLGAVVKNRMTFRALHLSGWVFSPTDHPTEDAVLEVMPDMDADRDLIYAEPGVTAVQAAAPHVTVVVRADTTPRDAIRLLQKLARAIRERGLNHLSGTLTTTPAISRPHASRSAELDGAA